MSNDITQTRICVERMLPHHEIELQNLKAQSNSTHHFQKLKAAFVTKKIWPQGSKIRIAFLETGNQVPRTSLSSIQASTKANGYTLEIDPLQKVVEDMSVQEAIKKIVRERIQPIVGLSIEFVDNVDAANVRISFDPNGGAWSLVGTDCLHEKSGATMNLGWFDVATTIHEFGHLLGMIHEHQNPAGNPIHWNDSKVLKWARSTQGWDDKTTETNIIDRYSINQINGSTFDPLSIMLYFFPADLTTNNQGTHQNLRLSGHDVEYISKIYPQSPKSPELFYKSVYGESLEEAKKESNIVDKGMLSGGKGSKNIWIGLVIIIGIVLLGFLIWKYISTLQGKKR